MGRVSEQLATLREILLAIVAGPLVRGTQQFDYRHQVATLAVPNF